MTIHYIGTNNSGAGTRLTLALGDSAVIGRAGALVSTSGFGIDGGGGNSVFVQGLIAGQQGAIFGFSPSQAATNRITVDVGGAIWGAQRAVSIFGTDSRLSNNGTLSSDQIGVSWNATGGGIGYLFNSGLIDGGSFGIDHAGHEILHITNTGTIRGLSGAIHKTDVTGSDGNLYITNRGVIIGDIVGGDGSDSYISRGEGRLEGTFHGGAGMDRLTSGVAADRFLGGAGEDTADYAAMTAVTLVLDGVTEGGGGALGDMLIDVESVIGSRLGADRISGNALDNSFTSLGGNDSLSGANGNDRLDGGLGVDQLTGGAGNDRFVFVAPGDGGDRITDFSSAAAGNNDRIDIRAAGFGGGLTVGAISAGQFIARADNHAQDTNDRFIFRTTDKTLWYDATGTLAGGPVLVADLQQSATMTFQDIVII